MYTAMHTRTARDKPKYFGKCSLDRLHVRQNKLDLFICPKMFSIQLMGWTCVQCWTSKINILVKRDIYLKRSWNRTNEIFNCDLKQYRINKVQTWYIFLSTHFYQFFKFETEIWVMSPCGVRAFREIGAVFT